MEDAKDTRAGRKQQLPYILTPLFLLIVCLATMNLVPALVPVTGVDPSIQTPMVASATPIAAIFGATSAPDRLREEPMATPALLPTPTPYIAPAMPPDTEIQLLGPPPGSAFRIGDTLSFYWQWPMPLEEDQSLAAYLLVENQELLVGRLMEPNVGTGYWLHVSMSDFVDVTDAVRWQVRLESTKAKQWLAASEIRPLALRGASESVP